MLEIELFIDESGQFIETSTDLQDRIDAYKVKRKFPSQLAGILFPRRALNEEQAETVIRNCCKHSNVEFTHQFHANSMRPDIFSDFVKQACNQLEAKKLQPFRMVNEEMISYGDRVSNYTNILAELLIQVCHELSKLGHESIALHVTAAKVKLGEDELGVIQMMDESDYEHRIREYFARAAVRKGYGSQTRNWKIGSFQLGSGKDNKILHLCDLVSNASHDDFVKCDLVAKSRLKASLGKFDFTLSSDTFYDEVNEFASVDSFGLAFVSMARRSVDFGDAESDELFNAKLAELGKRFNQLSASVKLPQLRILMAWLQQGIAARADLGFSLAAAKWIRTSLAGAIGNQADSDELLENWLTFTTTSLMITTLNHLGQTVDADRESNQLNGLIPALAGRWEYSTEIFEALIAQAVHKNDCFDHQAAKVSMESVAGFFENLTGFFSDAFPGLFPECVQSDLWAKALGTKVQSETFLLLQGKGELEQVRQTSDAAIEQFALLSDKQRQYQFRSEIEAIGGNWELAREFLAKSLRCESSSHEAIATSIAELELERQGFPFLHWTRLGGMAASQGDRQELKEFYTAFKSKRFANNQWVIGTASGDYPIHGILRRMAVVNAFNGDKSAANAIISRLRNIVSNSEAISPIFEAILVAALVQVAAILYRPETKSGIEYLDCKNPQKLGAKQVIQKLVNRMEKSHPMLAEQFSNWGPVIESVLNGEQDPGCLADIGSQIGY
ncbi:hypothetical protein N9B22_00265 [bacterium]|nr:hypothetical protein [bacterium]